MSADASLYYNTGITGIISCMYSRYLIGCHNTVSLRAWGGICNVAAMNVFSLLVVAALVCCACCGPVCVLGTPLYNVELVPVDSAEYNVELVLVDSAVQIGAVCLDGSAPGYYFRPGKGSGSNSWIVHMEGGGWCYNETLCVERSKTRLGSSKSWPPFGELGVSACVCECVCM